MHEASNFSSVLRVTGGSLANCTVVSNDVSRGWTVSAISGTTSFGRIANCLIACNRSANPDVAYAAVCNNDGTAGSMSHCAGDRETGKEGIVFAEDFKFVDATNGDWRIHCWSPAARKADTSVITATKDLAGAPTVYLRNKADIGCYSRIDKPGMSVIVK